MDEGIFYYEGAISLKAEPKNRNFKNKEVGEIEKILGSFTEESEYNKTK